MARPKRHMVKIAPQNNAQIIKEEAVKEMICLQYQGKDITNDKMLSMVKSVWKQEGRNEKDIKSIDIYIKPEESQIYYVVNGDVTGNLAY